ncbi:hypothetical protein CTAYLR_003392 [Chrysophaeum taylorii]|uniref:Signal recognition particle SRP54 subunit M-domain domain-containing protein n=1 Tax=Chrysophaeum taylorii TaxID=2483200 RepID=A0AAD7XIT2_9STRA|nr:hypothetical protein CTAYLR_003392 [Chrysophaeum taylorii]
MTPLLFVSVVAAFIPPTPPRPHVARRTVAKESLGGALLKQVVGGIQDAVTAVTGQTAAPSSFASSDVAAGREAAQKKATDIGAIDSRARSGDVSFEDFLKVGRTFREMGGRVPNMPGQLTPKQIEETMAKFAKHEKIVLAMTDEERGNPQLVLDDLDNTDDKCPRVQRLSRVSGVPERDVAIFCAEFEAMRQSTRRIAAGEDPDEVNADIGASNRAQRRAAKKSQKKKRR